AIAAHAFFACFRRLGLLAFGARFDRFAVFALAAALAAAAATASPAFAVVGIAIRAGGDAGYGFGVFVLGFFFFAFSDGGAGVSLFSFDFDVAALRLAAARGRRFGLLFFFEAAIEHDDLEIARMHRRRGADANADVVVLFDRRQRVALFVQQVERRVGGGARFDQAVLFLGGGFIERAEQGQRSALDRAHAA